MGKRRAKGEGTVFYSETEQRWIAQLTLPNGKKKSKLGKTQAEVRKWLLEQRKAIEDNAFVDGKAITLSAFLDRYMNDVAAHKLSPKTIDSYSSQIRLHIKPELGSLRLSQIRPDHVQNFYSKKLEEGLSRRTVQYFHAILHKALGQAVRWSLVVRNVSDLVDAPTPKKGNPKCLTVAQARKLFDQVEGTRYEALYKVAILMGLREGEVLGLTWDNVKLDEKKMLITQAVQFLPKKGLVITSVKTDASKRGLPIPGTVHQALVQHREKFPSERFVFSTANNTPIAPRNILRNLHQTLKKMGLPRMKFHELRHTCSSIYLAAGVNPKTVQALLGHSTVMLTMDTYSHLLPGVTEEAVGRVDKLFADDDADKAAQEKQPAEGQPSGGAEQPEEEEEKELEA